MTPLERYDALKKYLDAKLYEGDWRRVVDAAVDLQVLEAKHPDVRQESKGLWRHPE